MTKQDQAFDAIRTERNYQDAKHPGPRTLDTHISLVQSYAQKLSKPGVDKLDVMREVAGIATRALEEHGAPMRGITGTLDVHLDAADALK